MPGIDSLLNIVVHQGADELRLGTDQNPKMFQDGAPKRLTIAATPEDTLRHLLGPVLSPELEAALGREGHVEFAYASPAGTFHVVMTRRGVAYGLASGFDIAFLRGGPKRSTPPVTIPEEDAALMPISSRSPRPGSPSMPPMAPAVSPSPLPEALLMEMSPRAFAESEQEAPPLLSSPITLMLARAVAAGASDVHLLGTEPAMMRVDGRVRALSEELLAPIEECFRSMLTANVRARLEGGRSVDIAFELPTIGRFRLNLYRTSAGLAAAVRVLGRTAPDLARLNLPASMADLVDVPHGLVVVCGPTGSGKSTTLAALAGEVLRRRAPVLIALEDPIEFALDTQSGGVARQRQVGRDVRDFATGLRDALREDPDVLVIGEMRDAETIVLAITAAETGHLVLASLHSRSASSAIDRILDAYPPSGQTQARVQLADALRAVVSQRLLPRPGGGRVAAVEILRGTHGVANLIREGKTAQLTTAMQSGRVSGMITLERSLAELVHSGQVSEHDAVATTNDPTAFRSYLKE